MMDQVYDNVRFLLQISRGNQRMGNQRIKWMGGREALAKKQRDYRFLGQNGYGGSSLEAPSVRSA
jgi:hypothetical protein